MISNKIIAYLKLLLF